MSLQRIVAIVGSAVLATALVAEVPAQAARHPHHDLMPLDTVVHFGFDSAELDETARRNLDDVVAWLEANPSGVVLVAGHTDTTGKTRYNMTLGQRRAARTKQYLVRRGIAPERIVTVSFGEVLPASGRPEENRRTVFYATRPDATEPRAPQMDDIGVGEPPVHEHEDDRVDMARGACVERPAEAPDARRFPEPVREVPAEERITGRGMSIGAGGGVIGFIDSTMRSYASPGATWDVRFVYGTRSTIAAEAAYYGSRQRLDTTPLDTDDDGNLLLGTGLEGNLRVNVLRTGRVQPYLIGGLGWTHYRVRDTDDNLPLNVQGRDNLLHIPLGAGANIRLGRLLLDLRGTVRTAFGENMVTTATEVANGRAADMSTWAVTTGLGWEF